MTPMYFFNTMFFIPSILLLAAWIVIAIVIRRKEKKNQIKHPVFHEKIKYFLKKSIIPVVALALLFGGLWGWSYHMLEKETILFRDITTTGKEVVIWEKGRAVSETDNHTLFIQVDGKNVLRVESICGDAQCEGCFPAERIECSRDDNEYYVITCGRHGEYEYFEWEMCEFNRFMFTADFTALFDYDCPHYTVIDDALDFHK